MLEPKMKAPDFTLPDKNGAEVCLSDFLGKKVVLYFYPKDNTPGCTRQACAFAAAYEVLLEGYEIQVNEEAWEDLRFGATVSILE